MQQHTQVHQTKKKLGKMYWFQYFFTWFFLLGTLFMSVFLAWALTLQIPDFQLLDTRFRSESTKIYDSTGKNVLYDVYGDVQRTIVPLSKINSNIQQATIAIEDAEFYQHIGIKPRAILRSVYVNFTKGGYAQGGSTITQQVVKNGLLSQEKTITRKVKEWILAIKLERVKTKSEILELYLNDAPYGGTIVGVEEASMGYFGKHASAVDLAEAAYLAALPQSPTRLRPHGGDAAALNSRKNLVLTRMRELGMISTTQEKEAKGEVVKFESPQSVGGGIQAPHFVMAVKQKLEDEYGEDYVKNGGLRVITTLDLDLQHIAEDIISKHKDYLQKNFNSDNQALVSLDPRNGHVLSMVGSRDYAEKIYGMYNVVTDGRRQPGSSFKPIIYSEAFREGYLPSTVVFDAQTSFDTRCDIDVSNIPDSNTECYRPRNYDGTYHGPTSLRNALAQSLNIPAVKMLYMVGIKKSLALAKDLGITTLDHADRFGLSLVLGAGEVSPLEMAQAYGAFANDGILEPSQIILRVENKDGKVLKEYSSEPKEVLPPQTVRLLSDVLSDNIARTPAFGANSDLYFSDRQVAVKTGTTNDSKDYWVIGYTPSIVALVWAGNHDSVPMVKKSAGFAVAPIWHDYLSEVFKQFPERFPKEERFIPPDPVDPKTKPALRGVWMNTTAYAVDTRTGLIAGPSVPPEFLEQRMIPNVGEAHDILHFVNKDDPTGPIPQNPGSDEQYSRWEFGAQKWLRENGIPGTALLSVANSTMKQPAGPTVEILIDENANTEKAVDVSDKYKIRTKVTSIKNIERVDFFLDGQFLGSARSQPYEFSFLPLDHQLSVGVHTIRVSVVDVDGISGETSMEENFSNKNAP